MGKYKLYPIPTTGILNIQTSFDIRSITIQDIHGNRRNAKTKNNALDVSNLKSGVYFLY
ncbi:MAG: T9SS type A sorting domain-containing protein [Saprospiraceae bacterium]|nr:T9SS type A sorting domain-containing protein [Saprospiraceae bacterium]